jgi:Bacterial Ig-like domain (group 2).
MKTTLFTFYKSLLAALLLFVSFAGWGQITSLELGTTSFTTNTTGSATFTSKDININAFPNLSLTTLQQTQAGGNGYVSSKNWQGTSISTTKYWEFTVTANSGYQISVSGIVWKGTRSAAGPTSFAIRSSVDNYASNLGTLATTVADLTFSNLGITNKTSITFRVYGWGASAATGTWRCGDGSPNSLDISVIGSVNAICTAPSQSFAKDPIDKNIGDPKFTNAFNTNSLGAVSYTSSDTSVATIDTSTGEVTIGSTTGSTIITASQAAGGGYCAATKTYTINVHPQVLTNIKGGGVNIVGQFQNPAYQQPINCDANDKRVLQYRKVSTTTSNPDDGRGQWATTLQAVSNPSTNLYLGEVYAGNYDPNNYNDGFLFTNGGGCGNTGTYDNKWNFSGNGQCGLDDVNIANYVTSGGANMGINISNSGFYTFVLKDNTGSTNGYYVGYTSNAPVNISSTEQSILCPNSATITATLSATPSPQEKFYLRYNTTNDFGGAAYTSQVLGTVSSTTVTFNVSSLSAATNYYYYILSTTVSGYDSYSEVDKSLSCLKYLDNNGNNYTLSTPAAINITNQPVGNSYCQNATPTALSVTATGASLTYQWYKNDTNSNTGGTLILGATGSTLAGANISTATAGTTYYYCTISTGSCTTPTATNAVAIIVNATPAITGTTSVCVGKTIQLTGSGTADSTTPWSTNNSVVATVDNAGLVTGVAAGTATITYKNSNGCSVSTTVIVNGNTAITTPPVNQTVTAGNTATFSVVATGSNLSYQWQVSTDCGITWSNIGTNSSSYTTPATDSSFDQNKYQVIVSGSCGSDVTSNIVTLSVNVSSNCLTDNFTTAEGWTSTLGVTYTGTGSSTGIPLTVTVPSGTWVLFNNSLNTSNNYLQLNSVGAYTQLPNLSKPNKITVTARTSGTNGSGDLTLQYKNSSDVWTDIETKGWSGTTEVSYDFIISSTISDVATQFRIYIPKLQSSTYVAKVLVSCNVLPTTPTDYTWTGNGGDTSWTTACNWSPKGVPTAIDNVTFNTSPTYLLNLTDSRTVNNLTLTDTGNFNASNTGILTY